MSTWQSFKDALKAAVITCDADLHSGSVNWADGDQSMDPKRVILTITAAPVTAHRKVLVENVAGDNDVSFSMVHDATVNIKAEGLDDTDALELSENVVNGLHQAAARAILDAEKAKLIDFALSSIRIDNPARDYSVPTFASDAIFRLQIEKIDPTSESVIENVNGEGTIKDADDSTVATINISESRP